MRLIRILFTIPNFLTAGSGREMFNIIERLDKSIFEPTIAVHTPGGNIYDEAIAKGYNVLVHAKNAEKTFGIFRKLLELIKLGRNFRKYRFDIWQSFNWSSDYTEAIAAQLAGAKYVYVKKNMNWQSRSWKLKSFQASAIIARNTTLVRSYFSAPFFKRKTVLIPGGVDVNKFQPASSQLRAAMKIPANIVLVTCVAQLVRIKDQLTLVKAISGIDNCILVLAGKPIDKEYSEEVTQFIEMNGLREKVLLLGAVDNVSELLNATDIFVLPTSRLHGHEEGCPVALLEAMACETPSIASNVAGSNDLISHEQTGLLFEPGDDKDLSACIRRYMTDKDLAKRVSENARELIREKYTLDLEAERFSELYKMLVYS